VKWKDCKLSDIADEIRITYKPNKNEILPYIGMEHVQNDMLKLASIGTSQEVTSNKYRFDKNNILFGTLRPYFKKIVKTRTDGVCSTEFSVIKPKDERDIDFLLYTIARQDFINYAVKRSKGDRPRTKWEWFSEFDITIPHIYIRQKIASFLSAYDDLIENNLRRIELLEKAARELYKEWFVRFKFPGHEKVKFMDGLPEGWERKQVKDLGKVVTGKTPSTKKADYFNGDILFIKTPDMHKSSVIIESVSTLSNIGADSQKNKYIPEFSIMVACIGARLGVVSLNGFIAQTNQQINTLIPSKEYVRFYSFFLLEDLKPHLRAMGGGATMPNVNKTKFENIKIIVPKKELIIEFNKFNKDVFKQIRNIIIQNQLLKQARDLLLPRLMKGEIEI